MPPIMSKPSAAAPASLIYITIGALMTVWSTIWYMYLHNGTQPPNQGVHYLCTGCLITGVVLLVIGFTLGPISRMARHAELPPTEVTAPVIQAEQQSAAAPRV